MLRALLTRRSGEDHRMKYFTPYRLAAYALVLFFVGHTFGGMFPKSLGPEADAVFASMKSVKFTFNGATCSWYGFWFGFGLTASVFLLLSAVMAWQLDRVPPQSWPAVSVMAWALVVAHLCNVVLSWTYFFAGPGFLSAGIVLLLAAGASRKQSAAARLRTTS
jgi:hypothetical protein